MFKPSITSLRHFMLAAVLSLTTFQNALSAPGNLPNAPLFLSTLVEPNTFVTLDDSGSMDWEILADEGTGGYAFFGGLPRLTPTSLPMGYYTPTFSRLYGDRIVLPPSDGTDPEWDKLWIFRNHFGNKNYYNPNIAYEAWPGADSSGNPLHEPFTNMAAIPKDPNDKTLTGETVNLNAYYTYTDGVVASKTFYIPTYFEWIDSDGDGVIETDDKAVMYYIGTPPSPPTGPPGFEVKPAPVTIPGIDPMQNFANWFVYHRSRINVTKFVIGLAINSSDAARAGIWLINKGLLAGNASLSDPAQKEALLNALYKIEIETNGTPTRVALEQVGNYFKRTDASAPILPAAKGGECQQNFNILMTDGFWNNFVKQPDGTFIDGVVPSANIGNDDGDNSSIFDGDDGRVAGGDKSNDGGNYADDVNQTLADVAMHFYENDLRGDLADKVPTQEGVDENSQQHLVNYTVGFGLKGSLDPEAIDPLAETFQWPTDLELQPGSIYTMDDLWHASYNSRGRHLVADNPLALQASVQAAITNISERTGTAAAVAVNSAQLNLESVIYLAQFNSNRWQGNLLALPILFDADGRTDGSLGAPKWDASSELTTRNITLNPRTIITFDDSAAVKDGVPFQWDTISTSMKNDLNTNASGGVDTLGEQRLEYLRGDRTNEGAGEFFRPRLSLLGDIVNSGPVFVGEPNLSWPDFAPFPTGLAAYSEFKNSNIKNRRKIVYVGANDGMLHAFDDDTGEEVFAYVPGMLASTGIGDGLHYLTEPNYLHKFYVDLTPALSDVFIGDNTAARKWRTVLVGAMRGGARGVYALDVTDPTLFTETNADDIALWEFTSDDDIDLGYTYSRPFIALANNGTWVAIFGNGYNDLGSGEASLFIVDIEKGTDGKWQVGDYKKISTGVGTAANRNGLATPALADVDGNGTVDRVYAGDLRGNMWVFDLDGANSSTWDVAYKSGSTPVPLFTTELNRPITARPVLAKHPTQPDSSSPSNAPNIMVFFGTGQYLVDADKSSSDVESYYGVWDKGDSSRSISHLIEQTFEVGFTDADGNPAKVLTRNAVDYSTDYGWYFKLEESGERSVTSSVARADSVFFNSFVPVNDPCSIGGFGFRYAVDMATGGSPLEPVFDADGDGIIDAQDTVSNGIATSTLAAVRQEGFLPDPVFVENSLDSLVYTGEEGTKIKGLKNIPTGRFSWQELLQ